MSDSGVSQLRVHWLDPLGPDLVARLSSQLPREILLTTSAGADAPPRRCDILVAARPDRKHLCDARGLAALVVPHSGVPPATREVMLEQPEIPVHRLEYNSGPTAEMAVALLLAAAKNLLPADRALRQRRWLTELPLELLAGGSALVLGRGAVGRHVGTLCVGLGMRVAFVRRRPDGRDAAVHDPAALPELLPRADALLVCLPLTPETRGMLGRGELGLLKPGAVVVNVGRAEVIDDAALFHALRRGEIFAAGLDVWSCEPRGGSDRPSVAPSAHPFETLDNVVLSPHRAFRSQTAQRARVDALARLLGAAARGETMPNRVDVAAGY